MVTTGIILAVMVLCYVAGRIHEACRERGTLALELENLEMRRDPWAIIEARNNHPSGGDVL